MSARPIPRKLPRQERSRRTYERILDAAARVLVAHGYDGASTVRIAAEAGVSPGSLYQYFPNKDAIVLATVERMTGRTSRRVIAAMNEVGAAEPREAIDHVLNALLDALEQERELVRVTVEQLPRLGGSALVSGFEHRVSDLATGYLTGLTRGIDPQRTATTVWIAVQCVEQLSTRYVLDRPPIPRETFVTELRRLVLGYAAAAAVRAGDPARAASSAAAPTAPVQKTNTITAT